MIIIRDIEHPYSQTGGLAVLFGNLAPDGCVVKTFGGIGEHAAKKKGKPRFLTAKAKQALRSSGGKSNRETL